MIREETVSELGQTTITWHNDAGQLHNNYDTGEWAITVLNPDGSVHDYSSCEEGLLHNLDGAAMARFDYTENKTHNMYAVDGVVTDQPELAAEACHPDTTTRRLTWLAQHGDMVVSALASHHPNASGSAKMFTMANMLLANVKAEHNQN